VVRTLATTPTATSVQARDEGSKHQGAAAAEAAGSSEVVVGGGVETWGGKETKFCGREEGIQTYSTAIQDTARAGSQLTSLRQLMLMGM
jgi:hypothetical protein